MENKVIKDIDILTPDEATACEVRVSKEENTGKNRKLYIESYGCQMNFSDSEIVTSILKDNGFDTTSNLDSADLILLNTCSIRDRAEQTVRNRLIQFNSLKKQKPEIMVGVLGCMAERLKTKLLEEEKIVDIVAGPDSYRDLPNLVNQVDDGHKAVNTFLSREETYADIAPVRLNSNGLSSFISIMRGCDNMCTFCVVPFTRGRERSRDPHSIVKEAQELVNQGYKEVTLLGQNVDSYKWSPNEELKGKAQIEKSNEAEVITFSDLLEMVAKVSPKLLIRFSTSHPKDITDEVLFTMAKYDNICKYIHLPAQSGNSRILEKMNRGYTREWYLNKVSRIREILGKNCGISSDFIAGFCSETEEEHQETLSLMREVDYHFSYMFYYSERPGTLAEKQFEDDVDLKVKKRRLQEIIGLQTELSINRAQRCIGETYDVLVEGTSKKSKEQLKGRNTENTVIVFDHKGYQKGDFVKVKVTHTVGATLIGNIID